MPVAPKVLLSNLIAEMARFKHSKSTLCCRSLILMINASFRMVREEVGDVNILVKNAGIMIIKQVLFKIITLSILAYIAASLSICNAHTKKKRDTVQFCLI